MTMTLNQTGKIEALYARYSSENQRDSTSIAVQIENCEKAASKKLVHFIDEATSGRSFGGREAWAKIMQLAQEGGLSRLWVFKYDRIGRTGHAHAVISDLEELGVLVCSATESDDALSRGIQLVIASNYSQVLAERTRLGLIKTHDLGFHTGGPPPYGYKVIPTEDGKKKRLAIDNTEADAIRMIANIYLSESVGMKEISRRLDNAGIKTRLGGAWKFTTIRGILTNRTLIGEVLYVRRTFKLNKSTGRRLPVKNDVAQHKVRFDDSLRILDDDTFNSIQEKLTNARDSLGARGPKQQRLFTHLLFCSECGAVCYSRRSKNARGTYVYYSCSCRQSKGPLACPNSGSVREDKLRDRVTRALDETFIDMESMIAEAVQLAQRQIETHRSEAARLVAEISGLEKEVSRLIPLLTDPALKPAVKEAIGDEIAVKRSRRIQLRECLDRLGLQAAESSSGLIAECRAAFQVAKESFALLASATAFNRFVEVTVGPMVVLPDGDVAQKEAPSGSEDGRWGLGLAGGGFEQPSTAIFGINN